MTMQAHDLAAQRSPDGWKMSQVPHGGGRQIHLLDEQGNKLRSFRLEACLPDFSQFAHPTTAGMMWTENALGYFTALQRHFVIRAWWGKRLVIALDRLNQVEADELSDELHRTECDLVMRGVRELIAEIEVGGDPEYIRPPTETVDWTVGTLAHFPGLLGLTEAVPLLRVLEEHPVGRSEVWGGFRFYQYYTRLPAQISLQRLGTWPQGYPALSFTEDEPLVPLRSPQAGPMDSQTRHTNLARIRRGTPIAEVYQLLGAPDEISGGRSGFWRYDVDAEPPHTVLLWLKEDSVARIVKYLPPFWAGPELFPSREHSLLDSDGRTGAWFLGERDGETFDGTRVEVDVLQELASSGRDPIGPLAAAVLDGRYDALPPLADALEEVDDLLTPRVRSWFKL